MAEIVDVLALSSKALVIRDSTKHKSSDHNNFHKGQELKIWDVTISEEEKKRLGIVSDLDRGQ
jgi:nuclear pore complex protein Nup107